MLQQAPCGNNLEGFIRIEFAIIEETGPAEYQEYDPENGRKKDVRCQPSMPL